MDKYLFYYSEQAKDFLYLLLTISVANRPTAEEALNHDWFSEIGEGIKMALDLNNNSDEVIDQASEFLEQMKAINTANHEVINSKDN